MQFLTETDLKWSGQTSGNSTSFFYRKNSTDPRQITRSVLKIKVEIIDVSTLNIISNHFQISCGMAQQDVQCIGKYHDKDMIRDTFSVKG